MKKIPHIFLLGFILILSSCEQTYYSVSVRNESEKTVRFLYDDSIYELESSKDKVFSVVAYTQPPVFLGVVPEGIKSVGIERDSNGYKFVELPPIPLYVANTLPVEITVKADDFIDNNSNGTVLAVEANSQKAGGIYTSNPKFTVTAGGYPTQVTYTITNNTMYVMVR
jgi:hypothetical protein